MNDASSAEPACQNCRFGRMKVNPDKSIDFTKRICKHNLPEVIVLPAPGPPGTLNFILKPRPEVEPTDYCGKWEGRA